MAHNSSYYIIYNIILRFSPFKSSFVLENAIIAEFGEDDFELDKGEGMDDLDYTPSTVSDDSSYSYQDDTATPTTPVAVSSDTVVISPPPQTSRMTMASSPGSVQPQLVPDSTMTSTYWSGYSSIPPMLPTYDPYLSSSHYDYPPSYYYPQEPASVILEHTEVINTANTTEDITFAEAFTALANFEPQPPGGDGSGQAHPPSSSRGSRGYNYNNQHIETFNELSTGSDKEINCEFIHI